MKQKFLTKLIESMSIDQKIGQMLTVILEGTTYTPAFEGFVMDYFCGGIRIVPSSKYNQRSIISRKHRENGAAHLERVYIVNSTGRSPKVTLEQYAKVIAKYREKAMLATGLPLRIAFDQEGGVSRDLTFGGAHVFPKPMGITAGNDPAMAYAVGKAMGAMARACGLNMIHSPILDVNVNPENPEIYTRSFSDNAEVVAQYALEMARGLKEANIIATGKHFPGRGDSIGDAHHEIPVIDIDYDTLWNRELLPYRVLIEHGVLPAIMTAHSLYPAVDTEEVTTLSAKFLKGILRDKLGFEGVITTDAIGMGGITEKYDIVTACLKTLQAGSDMILLRMPTSDPIGPYIPKIVQRIKEALDRNELTEAEIDEKLYRILSAYDQAQLFDERSSSQTSITEVIKDEHIAQICQITNERSICILRDEDELLPLAEGRRALVIEQRFPDTYCPHDAGWYSGLLYDRLSRYSNELSYIETTPTATPAEIATVMEHCDNFDLIIMSNWFYRSEIGSNSHLVEELSKRQAKLLILANTPYETQCVPGCAKNVIVQFGVTPKSIEVVSDIIFGRKEATGVWPIQYRPQRTPIAAADPVHC